MRNRFLSYLCVINLIWTTGAHAQQPPISPLPPAPPPPVIPPVAPPPPPLFTDAERASLVAFWNAPGRLEIAAPPDAASNGPWQVRLTPEGSAWLHGYQKAIRGAGKVIPPTQDARASQSSPQAEWETWITARVAYDRYQAGAVAASANAAVRQLSPIPTAPRTISAPVPPAPVVPPTVPVAAPGPIPPALLAACGNPPRFANAVSPLQYTIRLDDPADTYVYQDNVTMRDRYAYYRFPRGTVAYGKKLENFSDRELADLFRKAGFTPGEQRIFTAVSGLEGGFETVNTYDTGYVSVGFIQFITLATGREDLARVMADEKASEPQEFQNDFHRLGMDIQPSDGTLTVVDPATGAELVGTDAVMRVIEDKRLTAVFQRAGRKSEAFRVAQIRTARASYWPAADRIQISLPNGAVISGIVSDFIKSEAGLATLLDRKVNVGNIRMLTEVAAQVLQAHKGKKLTDLARHEREIITAMKYRSDFLKDKKLSQPR
ncbi:MAG: hypothetical protein V4671_03550 [Armatimonadota bacterium]